MKTKLIPYLNFDGNAAEAMKFYHLILGGNLEMSTFADAFPETPDGQKDRIMHASLENDAINIMASDTHPEHSAPLSAGNNITLSIVGSDKERLSEYFNKLAEEGRMVMPLEDQFWGDAYGMLEDKFGVYWAINIFSS